MPASKRYKQLKLCMDSSKSHYDSVVLIFKIKRQPVEGVLNGCSIDWVFQSDSPAFLKLIPSGRLQKYALWLDTIPRDIDKVYDGILEAAYKAGYDLSEKGVD